MSNDTLTYNVPGMSCGHCRAAVTSVVVRLAGVTDVGVDLESKVVRVSGDAVSDAEVRAAIEEAGYEVAR